MKNRNISIYDYEDIENNINDISHHDVFLLVTEDYPLPGEDFDKTKQIVLVKEFIQKFNDKLILIGLRSPYELEKFPTIKNYICTYSSRSCSAKALIKKLFKE